ncbi:unnamed protein product [Cercospora beticola]|nr:unnamed protein product [Cercospora beticola]
MNSTIAMEDQVAMPNAASKVFHIPELLELILLSLPSATTHQEIAAHRTILLSQTASRTWHLLLKTSTPIREFLYRPTPLNNPTEIHKTWNTKHPFPPSRPNTWIPILLLQQRSWGSAWPFELSSLQHDLLPSQPRFWNFSLEISERQFRYLETLDQSAKWREMLASSPPFTEFWYTRTFYELGSGRAPFVQWLDYDGKKPKWEQKFVVRREEGVRLGDLVDAVRELFEKEGSGTRFVLVESLRVPSGDGEVVLREEGSSERGYVPGMASSERVGGWYD